MLKHNDALFVYIHSIGSLFKRYDSNSECNDTNPIALLKNSTLIELHLRADTV